MHRDVKQRAKTDKITFKTRLKLKQFNLKLVGN